MAKASSRPGFHTIQRPARYEPFNDPAVLTANAEEAVKAFRDLVRRSREVGGHDDDALKNDQPLHGFLRSSQNGGGGR